MSLNPEKQLQLDKLARTLLKSNLAGSYEDAVSTARTILKIPEPLEPLEPLEQPQVTVDVFQLPEVEDISPVPVSIGADFSSDKTLKEVLDEDARRVYNKQLSPKQ